MISWLEEWIIRYDILTFYFQYGFSPGYMHGNNFWLKVLTVKKKIPTFKWGCFMCAVVLLTSNQAHTKSFPASQVRGWGNGSHFHSLPSKGALGAAVRLIRGKKSNKQTKTVYPSLPSAPGTWFSSPRAPGTCGSPPPPPFLISAKTRYLRYCIYCYKLKLCIKTKCIALFGCTAPITWMYMNEVDARLPNSLDENLFFSTTTTCHMHIVYRTVEYQHNLCVLGL